MAKRDPLTGEFIKRADGKIVKPEGWKAPDVMAEISRQLLAGSWAEEEDEGRMSSNSTPVKA